MSDDGLQVIMPNGLLGVYKEGSVEEGLSKIAKAVPHSADDWPEKYGVNYENGTFLMHMFCWCDKDGCSWCHHDAPNFIYKPAGIKLWWYKYIGRSMKISGGALYIDMNLVFYD